MARDERELTRHDSDMLNRVKHVWDWCCKAGQTDRELPVSQLAIDPEVVFNARTPDDDSPPTGDAPHA